MNHHRPCRDSRSSGSERGRPALHLMLGAALLVLGPVACGPPANETGRPRPLAPRAGGGAGLEDLEPAIVPNPPGYAQHMQQAQLEANDMLRRLIVGSAATREAQSLGVLSSGDESLNVIESLADDHLRLYFGKLDAKRTTFLAVAAFDWKQGKVTPRQFDAPRPLDAKLSAEARAILTIKEDLNRRRPGAIEDLIKKRRLWMNHFVRRRPDGRIDAWLVPFPMVKGIEAMGGDHYFLVSEDGSTVIRSVEMHARSMYLDATNMPPPGSTIMHRHEAVDGDLPTATDLLKLMTSSHLDNLVLQGPRYSILLRILDGQRLFVSPLYDTRRFNAIMKSKGVM